MISEKGLCKVLSAAYKGGGYSVIPVQRRVETVARTWRRNEIILNGATWAVRCLTEDLPKEAAVQIVKDVGYMPMDPVSVQKNQPNQTMLEDVADIRGSQLAELRDGSSIMVKIPVIFRDRWQLYQTTTGTVYAFDTELLKLIDFKEAAPECRITPHGNMAMFAWGDEMVFLAPGRFSRDNEEKIIYIAGMDWENQVEEDDPVVNLNLFNADRDEPVLTPED